MEAHGEKAIMRFGPKLGSVVMRWCACMDGYVWAIRIGPMSESQCPRCKQVAR